METLVNGLYAYLTFLRDGKFGGISKYADLLLMQGTQFVTRQLAASYERAAQWQRIHKPQIKQCFYNSQLYCLTDSSARYFEGYSFFGMIPILHAWIVMPDDQVVDFTLEALKSAKIDDTVYLGVHVPTDYVRKMLLKRKFAEPCAQNYYMNTDARFMLD